MAGATIACVLNPSQEYGTDYIDKLRDGLARHCRSFDFLPLFDGRWPGWWSKMALFEPGIKGDLLYFDLDTVIVGPIDDLFIGKLTMLSDFNRPEYVASGVMYLPEAARELVWREWVRAPDEHMRKHRGHGDGGFLSKFYKQTAARWQNELPGQIVSYKKHVRGNDVPSNARVVCFHGRPRPRDIDWKL